MTPQILDASVAVKWYAVDEPGRAEALNILEQVQDAPAGFVVPELFFNEMLTVLARLTSSVTALRTHMEGLQGLGFERVGNGRELLSEAAGFVTRHRLSGYDAIYAGCARLTGGIWLTADARAHRRLQKQKISRLICN